jgi:trigger factor
MKRSREQSILKGFRPGKVPKEVLKRQFGKAVFGEVLDKVLKETSTKALKKIKLNPQVNQNWI